ncbi:MAG: tRNA 2-selenouridine(34) synthase MnmH [Nanoarchaeota archaeon]
MPPQITIQEALQKQKTENTIFIDTRAPIEFEEDHLPNAINVPIINNQERVIVGTIYKQVSQEKAIDVGMGFYRNRIPIIMKAVEPHKDKTMIVYCWRGGLRSKTIAALLETEGYTVFQLAGGYKAYRAYVREKLNNYTIKSKVITLYGLTCTGKTALLKHFQNSIDLEECAGHRGSMYGGIGIQQNSQKRFENLLFQKLEQRKEEKYILVEGESKRIGNIFIPEFFYHAMESGIKIKITRSLEKRAQAGAEEYCDTEEKQEEMRRITKLIRQRMSNKTKEDILIALDKKEYEKAWTLLFTEYYDPLYDHYLEKQKYVATIENDDEKKAVEEIKGILRAT